MIVFLWAYLAPRRMGLQPFWNTDKNNSVQKLAREEVQSLKPW